MYKSETFSPIWRHETADFVVELHGNEPRYTTDISRLAAIKAHTAAQLTTTQEPCYMHTASGPAVDGFRDIIPVKQNVSLQSDGAIMDKSGAVILQTADCPTLVLCNSNTNRLLTAHAGRPACSPDCTGANIVTDTLEIIAGTNPKEITAVITGAIQGKHLRHDADENGHRLTTPFRETFGSVAFANVDTLAIDLVQLITWQLTSFGILAENIIHDGLCTYEHEQLASYRKQRNRTEANTVVIIKK